MYRIGNEVEGAALQALLKFNSLAGGRWEPESLGGLSQVEFDHAVREGLLFRPNKVNYSHAEVCDRVLDVAKRGNPETHAALFLASLSNRRLDYRVGLPAYAIARTLNRHDFEAQARNMFCAVCGMTTQGNHVGRSDANLERFRAGGVVGTELPSIAFYLECQSELSPVEPTAEDLRIFSSILDILSTAEPDETAKKRVLREVKQALGRGARLDQAKYLLETLGYCGILETAKHGGMLDRYVALGTAPAKTHSSDWRYPVDFWTGKDGLNKRAMRFWFGGYEALARFM